MASFKFIVAGSKFFKNDNGEGYICTTLDDKKFFSHKEINGGICVQLTQRIAGTEYKKGTETKKVEKDGWNLDFVIGDEKDIKGIALAKAALVELATV